MKKMKLHGIELCDFGPHASLKVAFGNRTLVTGQNHVGKTYLKDGVKFAATGLCRGIEKKNLMAAIGRDGAKPRVALSVDTGEVQTITRSLSSCSLTNDELEKIGLVSPLVDILCDAYYFIDGMTAKERQAFVMNTLAGEKPDLAGKFTEFCAMVPTPPVNMILSTAATDCEAAYKEAYEERRTAGRLVKEAEAAQATAVPTKVVISTGAEIDITGEKFTLAAIRTKLDQRTKELAEYKASIDGGNLVVPEQDRARISEIVRLLAEAPSDDKFAAKIAEAKKVVATDEERYDELRRKSAEPERKYKTAVVPEEGAESKCDVCGAGVKCENVAAHAEIINKAQANKAALKKAWVKATSAENAAKAALDEARAALAALEAERDAQPQVDRAALLAEKKSLEDSLKLCAAFIAGECNPETQAVLAVDLRTSTKKQKQVDDGHKILNARETWESAKAALDGAAERLAGLKSSLASWEKLVEFLKEEGPARTLLASAATGAKFPEELAKAWGATVEVTPEGAVLFKGRPVELASASERLECGVLVQAWIAGATLGWLVVDEAEKLVGADKAGFLAWLKNAPADLQIVAIVSCATAPEKLPVEWKYIRIGQAADEAALKAMREAAQRQKEADEAAAEAQKGGV